MNNGHSDEAQRIRLAYARRAELGLDSRYAYWQPANLFIFQSRERTLLNILRIANMLPMHGRKVLDTGCGDGSVLFDLLRYGAAERDLHGIDLLPDRIEHARERLPRAKLEIGDAQSLAYPEGTFDVVLGFTLLSSVLNDAVRRNIASEMLRVVRPGGLILLYDFRINPFNRDARPLKPDEVRALFPGVEIDFHGTTLAPPLTRFLMKLPGGRLACTALEVIPFLRTHFLAAVKTQPS